MTNSVSSVEKSDNTPISILLMLVIATYIGMWKFHGHAQYHILSVNTWWGICKMLYCRALPMLCFALIRCGILDIHSSCLDGEENSGMLLFTNTTKKISIFFPLLHFISGKSQNTSPLLVHYQAGCGLIRVGVFCR